MWIDRVAQHWNSVAWLNPTPQRHWDHTPSIGLMKQLVGERMFPLTIEGLDAAMRASVAGGGSTSDQAAAVVRAAEGRSAVGPYMLA